MEEEKEEELRGKFKRPEVLRGIAPFAETPCGKLYIIITEYKGKPVEVFLEMGKSGMCQKSMFEAFGRVITKALQWGLPIDEVADSLSGINCKGAKLEKPSCLSLAAGKLRLGNNIGDFWKKKEEKKDEG